MLRYFSVICQQPRRRLYTLLMLSAASKLDATSARSFGLKCSKCKLVWFECRAVNMRSRSWRLAHLIPALSPKFHSPKSLHGRPTLPLSASGSGALPVVSLSHVAAGVPCCWKSRLCTSGAASSPRGPGKSHIATSAGHHSSAIRPASVIG